MFYNFPCFGKKPFLNFRKMTVTDPRFSLTLWFGFMVFSTILGSRTPVRCIALYVLHACM